MEHRPRRAGRAHGRQPPQPRRRLRARLPRRPDHPVPGARARPEPAPGLQPREARQAEAGLRRRGRNDDRRQLDPAQRRRQRRAAGERGVGQGPRPARARLPDGGPDRRRRPRPQAGRPADGARLRDAAHAGARGARDRRLRLLRDPRGIRGAGALHAGRLGGPGVQQGEARPRRPLRLDRPGQAQRQRRQPRRRPPVRGDRRADRRGARQAAPRRRQGPRRHKHLRRRRPGRRRGPRERRRAK